MGKKHQNMQKIKKEKSKVKLKGSKHLPKGTNVTDTSFKIKQIVIREQLKVANEAEPLSKRKLNVKELLSRLQHYNNTVKSDAIKDLKDIITHYPQEVVNPNVNQLIQGVSHLILDKDKTVRRESLKLIALILSQITVDQIAPFFDILSSYFRCAMTHIDLTIQEDSLLLLDVLLTYVPSLVAKDSSKIMDNFFDLISKLRVDLKPGRTLTINLNRKMTSVKWRIKVLQRLHTLLEVIINEKQKDFNCSNKDVNNKTENLDVKYDPAIKSYPIYHFNNFDATDLNLRSGLKNQQTFTEDNITKYIDILVPLLFETWLEVGPNDKTENVQIDVTLTDESTAILNSILHILLLLHKFLEIYIKNTGDQNIKNNFIKQYSKDFTNHIVSYFPYKKMGSKKRKRHETPQTEVFCITENFMICNIFCIFNNRLNKNNKEQLKYAEKLLKYVSKVLRNLNSDNKVQNKEAFSLIKYLLLDISKNWKILSNEFKDILNESIFMYSKNKLSESMKSEFLIIFCNIFNYDYLNGLPYYQAWLTTLPELLCKPEVNDEVIKIISIMAKKKNMLFNDALNKKFDIIIGNLSQLKVINTTDEIQSKNKILGLAHYASSGDVTKYVDILNDSNCDETLKLYFKEMLLLYFQVTKMTEMLLREEDNYYYDY